MACPAWFRYLFFWRWGMWPSRLVTACCCCVFASAGAVLGFLLLNYPRGLIFAGDGGAYLVGFLIAEISVLLVARHSEVSAWFPLLLVIYPVFETFFSIYRRKFLQDRSVGCPDALHLHQMIYKRLVRWMVGSKEARHVTRRNSLTAPYLWVLASVSVVPAMLFWRRPHTLMLCTLLFVMLYVRLYLMIIRFKSPSWLMVKKKVTRRRRSMPGFGVRATETVLLGPYPNDFTCIASLRLHRIIPKSILTRQSEAGCRSASPL